MQRHHALIVSLALLVSACGGAQTAEQPTALAPSAPAPTAVASALPTSLPTAAAVAATAAPTAELFRADPTAPAQLQPTTAPEPAATAIPTVEATPAAVIGTADNTENFEPTRIVIEAVGIDQAIVSVGLDQHRVPIVPDHEVGWYNLSAQPGQGENIVLWGHVLRFRKSPGIPAPFAKLKEAKPGAQLLLYDKAGTAHQYVVKQQIWVTPDQVEYILPQGKELVTLVSCIGDQVIASDGGVIDESHRLITVAEPAA